MYKIEALDSIFYHCIKYIGYNDKHTYLAALLNMSKCLVVFITSTSLKNVCLHYFKHLNLNQFICIAEHNTLRCAI